MHSDDLERIFQYIAGIIRGLDGIAIEVGGISDHVHILASLPKTMKLIDFVRTIKSESSKWIKKLGGEYLKFSWQDGYGAFSVSSSLLNITASYIRNQSEHHRTKTFIEEYKAILEEYGISYDEKYAFGD